MSIGVLALQGAFAEHMEMLRCLQADAFEIRQLSDLNKNPHALIIPGGESTVQGKLLYETGLLAPLKERIENGLPVFGTCAGMILLAQRLYNDPQCHLGVMDITVKRNAYGRQLASFYTEDEFIGIGKVPMTFIRAPYIQSAGDQVDILAQVRGNAVAAREGNMLVTSFHPELNQDTRIHEYFLHMAEQADDRRIE